MGDRLPGRVKIFWQRFAAESISTFIQGAGAISLRGIHCYAALMELLSQRFSFSSIVPPLSFVTYREDFARR
jgi:hypothetical protein